MPEIIGIYNNKIVWICDKGFCHTLESRHSGCLTCDHSYGYTSFDFLDVSKLDEITDDKIINLINGLL